MDGLALKEIQSEEKENQVHLVVHTDLESVVRPDDECVQMRLFVLEGFFEPLLGLGAVLLLECAILGVLVAEDKVQLGKLNKPELVHTAHN